MDRHEQAGGSGRKTNPADPDWSRPMVLSMLVTACLALHADGATKIISVTPATPLPRVMDQIRSLRAGRKGVPVVVRLQDGVYRLGSPLLLTDRDSQTTIEAAPGAHPCIVGSAPVTGWRRVPGAPPGVMQASWPAGLATAPRALFSRSPGRPAVALPRAQSPSTGWLTVDGPIKNTWTWGPGGRKEGLVPSRFRYREGDVKPGWAAIRGLEVTALLGWAEVRMPVAAIDPATRTITLAGTLCPSNREENCRYRLEGLGEFVSEPGSWAADPVKRIITMRNASAEGTATQVEVPVTDQLVQIQGDALAGRPAEGIIFKGITFSMSGTSIPADGYVDVQAAFDIPAAVRLEGARRCHFDRCEFRAITNWAVGLGAGCSEDAITRCRFSGLGAGAIKVGEFFIRNEPELACRSNTISDCIVRDVGNHYFAAPAIWVGQSGGNRVSHNLVTGTRSSGISVGWSWRYEASRADHNLIEYNRVTDIGQGFLSDLGGIYTLGIQPGTAIRGNIVRRVRSRRGGGWGIYLDEGSSGILVEGNLVQETTSAGFFLHYGRDDRVTRNAFIHSSEPNILRYRDEGGPSFVFERNLVVSKGGLPLDGDWQHQESSMSGNLYWSSTGNDLLFDGKSFAQWQAAGYDAGSVVADPGIRIQEPGDIVITSGSRAAALLGRGGWQGAGPTAR